MVEDLPPVEGGDEPLVSLEILCRIALELVATRMDVHRFAKFSPSAT